MTYAIFDITGITRRLSSLGEFETFEDAMNTLKTISERKYWELA